MSQKNKYLCELFYSPLDSFVKESIVYSYTADDAAEIAKEIFKDYGPANYYIKIWLFQKIA